MKSLERRFNNITKKNLYWSSCTCFTEAIEKQNFSKQTIHRWFNKLVEKDAKASLVPPNPIAIYPKTKIELENFCKFMNKQEKKKNSKK